MTTLLCRPTLSLTSGAGQLMRLQAEGLRAAGERVELHCRRGGLKFFLRTGLPVRRAARERLRALAASPDHLLVDHGMQLPWADVVFVHNLLAEAVEHLERADWRAGVSAETEFFGALQPEALVVANSELVRRGLLRRFALAPERVVVERPGYRRAAFDRELAEPLRRRGRRDLGLDGATPLVGLLTSGDFEKRGLETFLDAAGRIARGRPDARFLVVGSKRLPRRAAEHPLVAGGRVLYRPKRARPEPWFAALDVLLYPARFEEFGLVVLEALALGIPVLTSRRVGASECLPPAYAPWLLEEPDAARFAEHALALLADAELARRLGAAGAEAAAAFDERRYAAATVALMREEHRKKGVRPHEAKNGVRPLVS